MSKPVPTNDPIYYGILSEAVYKRDKADSEAYIKTRFPGAQVLESKTILGFWKYILVKKDDEITVAFRGIVDFAAEIIPSSLSHIAGLDPIKTPFLPHFQDPILFLINADLREWEKKHGKIAVFTGHSKGGYLADHVKTTADVFRIVFNGQKTQVGEKNINLRTENDILHKTYVSFKGRSINIGSGGHSMEKSVLPNLKDRTWVDILSLPQQPQPPTKNVLSSLSPLMTSVMGFEAAATLIADRLDQDQPVLDEASLKDLDQLSEASPAVVEDLDREWRQNSHFGREILACVPVIALGVYGYLQQEAQERHIDEQIRTSYRQHERQKARQALQRDLQEDDINFHQMERGIARSLNPDGIGHSVRDIKEFTEQFKQDTQIFKEHLESKRKAGETLEQLLQNVDKLDAETQKYYKKQRKSQKKLSKKLRSLGNVLNVTTGVLARIPMVDPGVMGAVQLAHPFLGSALAKKQTKLESKRQRDLERIIDVRHQITTLYAHIGSQRDHLLQQQEHFQELLLRRGDLFDPTSHLEGLQESVGHLTGEMKDINRKLAEKQAALEAQKQAVSTAETETTQYRQFVISISPKKKQQKRQAQHGLDRLNLELAQKKAQAINLEQEVQTLEDIKRKNEAVLNETQKIFDESQYVSPLRMHTWAMLVREEESWSRTDEKTRMLQVHIQNNFRLYSDARLNERQVAEAVMTSTMAFTNEIERMQGYSWPHQVASLSSNLYQLSDLMKHWKDFALPQLQLIKDNYSGGSWANVRETVGNTTFILQFCVPALRTVTLGLGCMRLGRNLSRSLYSIYNPPQPVRERLPEHFRDLVTEDCKELPPGLELHLQALGRTLKLFQATLDENFAFLQKQLRGQHLEFMGELERVRSALGVVGNQLLLEIDASKNEIIQEMHEGGYNQYITWVKWVGQNHVLKIEKYKSKLQAAKDPAKAEELHAFLTHLETQLQTTTADIFNGMNMGNSTHSNGVQPYPVVDITLAYRNPAHVTGLLTSSLGIEEEMPNWQLLETLTQGFLETITILAQDPAYSHILKTDERVREQLSKVCTLILEQQMDLSRLSEQIPILIQRVCKQQRALCDELVRRTQMVRSIKTQYISKAQNEALTYYTPTRQRVLTDDFVGSSKFFLHQAFVEGNLPVPAWGFHKMYFQDPSFSTRLRRRAPLVLGTAMNVTVIIAVTAFLTSPTMYPADSTVNLGSFSIINRSAENRIAHNQLSIEQAMSKSLRALHESTSRLIVFSTLPQADDQALVSLDLKQRKLVCITPTESTRPVLNLHVNAYQPQLGVEFRNDGLIQLADLQRIPEPGYVQQDAAKYDEAVKTLIQGYLSFLDNVVKGTELSADNAFQPIAKSSQIVPGINGQLIPLALPKKLIEALEEQLNPELKYLEATGAGMMVPFYNFSSEDYKLTILYRFVSLENISEPKDYCKFTIAQFNPSAVNAFQKDLRSPNGFGNTAEFLIQALYGSFGSNLGLPGQGTEVVSSGLIAPKEIPFVGLYRLWEKFPGSMVNYQSSIYTEALSQNLQKAASDEQADAKQLAMVIYPRQSAEFCKDYIDIWSKIYALKKDTQGVEAKFKSDFYLLLAMVKLLSGVDNNTLFGQLDMKLNLLPPEQQDGLADRALEEGQLTTVPETQVDLFVKLLSAVPSDRVARLRLHFQKLIELHQLLSKT